MTSPATAVTQNIPDYRGTGAGKRFEVDCIAAIAKVKSVHANRYGVQCVGFGGELRAIQSLPDIEGVTAGGRQFMFDCKVISGASYPLNKLEIPATGKRSNTRRQLDHMLIRSRLGVRCGFAMHFNSREMKTKSLPAETWFVPVHPELAIWDEFLTGERRGITRGDCRDCAIPIEWQTFGGRKLRPDIVAAIRQIM